MNGDPVAIGIIILLIVVFGVLGCVDDWRHERSVRTGERCRSCEDTR